VTSPPVTCAAPRTLPPRRRSLPMPATDPAPTPSPPRFHAVVDSGGGDPDGGVPSRQDAEEALQRALGARLREARRARGLTLQDVEERSGGRWKAVVIGSYERGDRAVSAARLTELA